MPPSVVATVMVLQRLEGLSDREAVERHTFDARWRYAAGVGAVTAGGDASPTPCWSTCGPAWPPRGHCVKRDASCGLLECVKLNPGNRLEAVAWWARRLRPSGISGFAALGN